MTLNMNPTEQQWKGVALISAVAILELSQTSYIVVEGNLTRNGEINRDIMNNTVCVVLSNELSGLERDIVIDVNTESDDAKSKRICVHDFSIWFLTLLKPLFTYISPCLLQ